MNEQLKLNIAEPRTYSVSELTDEVKKLLENKFFSVWVEGEVSNHSRPASGHHYFTLKDEGAQIRCVMFKQQAMFSKYLPKDGVKIKVHARISVYAQRGEYQLMADRIEPLGIGSLEIAFRELKEKLAKEGLFDQSHKMPMPKIPRKVGVVTSATGAAVRDIIRTIISRSGIVDILLAPVKVQGEGAAREIADAIATLDGDANPWGKLDVIIVGRGGGGIEDLWAFNEEIVARAIFACNTPIISAVGHETDFTIADFVADLRAATPTAAAQIVSPAKDDLEHFLIQRKMRMENFVLNLLENCEDKLAGLKRALPDPIRDIEDKALRLDELALRLNQTFKSELKLSFERIGNLGERLKRSPLAERIEYKCDAVIELRRRLRFAANGRIDKSDTGLKSLGARLGALNPLAVLDRGYSVTLKSDGSIISDINAIDIGEEIKILLKNGKIAATVTNKEP